MQDVRLGQYGVPVVLWLYVLCGEIMSADGTHVVGDVHVGKYRVPVILYHEVSLRDRAGRAGTRGGPDVPLVK